MVQMPGYDTSKIINNFASNMRSQKYYDELAQQLERGMVSYNPRTGKTILANKHCTAVISGGLPFGVTFNRNGKLVNMFDTCYNTLGKVSETIKGGKNLLGNAPSSLQMLLFENPNSNISWQNKLLFKIFTGKFVKAKGPSTLPPTISSIIESKIHNSYAPFRKTYV